jgi:hypothetical protein
MFNFYHLFIAVVGFAASMAFIEPTVRRLQSETKSALDLVRALAVHT